MKALVDQGFEERSVRAGTLMSSEEDYEEMAAAAMPCCLVEVGFISDEKDNKLFDNKLSGNAKAMAKAISETFATQYEPVEDEDL
jgi:N-acetylmuramoyl-L-alanine amidase